jgi:hypothetical protein
MTVNDELLTDRECCPGGVHEHAWQTESAHRTSLGLLRYVICPGCRARRVDLQRHPQQPPAALSVPVRTSDVADQSRAGRGILSGSARE